MELFGRMVIVPYAFLWSLVVPLKIKILDWLPNLNKIHTKDNMPKKM